MTAGWANEYTRRIARELYTFGDPVGEGFDESVRDMAEHDYSKEEAKEQLAWDIRDYFADVHAGLCARANPIQLAAVQDFDEMQIDFDEIAEGFLADYRPSGVYRDDNRRSGTAGKARWRHRR